jgi:threonine aldolase
MRFISAQLDAYLEDGLWLKQAAQSNALARQLAEGLQTVAGVTLGHPVEANAVFAWLPDALAAKLRDKGARFYDWEKGPDERVLVRLVLSFATPPGDVTRFLDTARA